MGTGLLMHPTYVWDVLADIMDYEEAHAKEWPCLHGAINRLPQPVYSTARSYAESRRAGVHGE